MRKIFFYKKLLTETKEKDFNFLNLLLLDGDISDV